MNKNLTRIKKSFAVLLIIASTVGAPLVMSGQVYADPPCEGVNAAPGCVPPATPAPPASSGSLSNDAKCTAGENACVPSDPDPAYKSGDLDCDGGSSPAGEATGTADAGCNLVTKYVNPAIKLLSGLAGVAVVIGIIVGGIEYAMSAGDAQQVSKAKNHIRNSVIALLVFFLLYALLNFLVPGSTITG